jgi:hypothetical protein
MIPKRRCWDNIRLALREKEIEDVDWIYLSQDRGWWQAVLIGQ